MTDDPNRNAGEQPMDRAKLARMLESYGADVLRWPALPDAAACALLESDPGLVALQREAGALDAVLAPMEYKSAGPLKFNALADRIVTAAVRSPRLAASAGASVERSGEAPVAQPAVPLAAHTPRPPMRGGVLRRDARRGVAVLAASLVLGLSLGQSGLMDRFVAGVEDLTGVSITSAPLDMASALAAAETGDEL
jgi:hypothetical protein